MENKKILVTGGSGLVGKTLKNILPNGIYLSSKDCNLMSIEEIENTLDYYRPDVIVHLAARVGGIIDNIKYPVEYFNQNILMNTLLLQSAHKFKIKRFIGILSTCVYPDVFNSYPMDETALHKGPPTQTNFSYAYAKRSLAVQIEAYNKQYGLNYQYLIPCNLYGEYDKYGENTHFVGALIKKIMIANNRGDDTINLFGTGKPLRQFIHADDLAYVIKYCIENDIFDNMNVATDEILSIKQMAEIAIKACDSSNLKIYFDSNYPDGQYRKDVSIELLRKVIPEYKPLSLFDGIKKTYNNINLES